MKRSNCWH